MRRRDFITLVGSAAAAPMLSLVAARAAEQVRRIGVLMNLGGPLR